MVGPRKSYIYTFLLRSFRCLLVEYETELVHILKARKKCLLDVHSMEHKLHKTNLKMQDSGAKEHVFMMSLLCSYSKSYCGHSDSTAEELFFFMPWGANVQRSIQKLDKGPDLLVSGRMHARADGRASAHSTSSSEREQARVILWDDGLQCSCERGVI